MASSVSIQGQAPRGVIERAKTFTAVDQTKTLQSAPNVATAPSNLSAGKSKGYAGKDVLKLWKRLKVQYGDLKIGKVLGKGSFGEVFECNFRQFSGCALKQLTAFKAHNEKARYVRCECGDRSRAVVVPFQKRGN